MTSAGSNEMAANRFWCSKIPSPATVESQLSTVVSSAERPYLESDAVSELIQIKVWNTMNR